jgi:hypothetical protein
MRSRSRRHPETDADRIGIWGSSYSGGHVLVVGAIDRRVKCVAGQVLLISGHVTLMTRSHAFGVGAINAGLMTFFISFPVTKFLPSG